MGLFPLPFPHREGAAHDVLRLPGGVIPARGPKNTGCGFLYGLLCGFGGFHEPRVGVVAGDNEPRHRLRQWRDREGSKLVVVIAGRGGNVWAYFQVGHPHPIKIGDNPQGDLVGPAGINEHNNGEGGHVCRL